MKTEFKLQPEAKAKWVKALRSGKYKQGCAFLKQAIDFENYYCCLGCARELKLARKLKDHEELSYKFLPEEIQNKLASMNDEERKSFPEIADWIEKNL